MVWGWVKSFKWIQRHLLRQGFPPSIEIAQEESKFSQIEAVWYTSSYLGLGHTMPGIRFFLFLLTLVTLCWLEHQISSSGLLLVKCVSSQRCRVILPRALDPTSPILLICISTRPIVAVLWLLSFSGCGTLSLDVNKTWLLLLAPPQLARLVSGKNLELWAFRLWHHLFSLLWPG